MPATIYFACQYADDDYYYDLSVVWANSLTHMDDVVVGLCDLDLRHYAKLLLLLMRLLLLTFTH